MPPEDLRRTCAAWPTGIAVVSSTGSGGEPVGLAVNCKPLVFHEGAMFPLPLPAWPEKGEAA